MTWAPSYVTRAEAKSYLRIGDDVDDLLIDLWAETASRAVDSWCGRQFGQVDDLEARTYGARWDRSIGWHFEIDDLMDVTGATATLGGEAIDLPTLEPVNGPARGRPYTRMTGVARPYGDLVVTALWGWSSVPVPVKAATLLQTARLAARRDAPFGIAGSPESGSEMRLSAKLDPDLQASLGSQYRRTSWAA